MNNNPYASSYEPARILRPRPASVIQDDSLRIRRCQRGIVATILFHLLFVAAARPALSSGSWTLFACWASGMVITWIAIAVFASLLADRLYDRGTALLLGALAALPIAGLLATLFVNVHANRLLRNHGLPVGFGGVKQS